jgi:hypothetical protein
MKKCVLHSLFDLIGRAGQNALFLFVGRSVLFVGIKSAFFIAWTKRAFSFSPGRAGCSFFLFYRRGSTRIFFAFILLKNEEKEKIYKSVFECMDC